MDVIASTSPLRGGAYSYSSPYNTVIGTGLYYRTDGKKTLMEIARSFDLGFNEIAEANPSIDPWLPPEGIEIAIPTIWILPETLDNGIVINLAEMRLYYFFTAKDDYKMVRTFPIGIGRDGISTPTGRYFITKKLRDPVWYPPLSARKEDSSLPALVEPGKDNPLGGYWLQLSMPGYGIHGTNRPWGIGRRVSRGCIRLYPEDISWLFRNVDAGTVVDIIDRHVKIGFREGAVYVEIHKGDKRPEDIYREILLYIKENGKDHVIDQDRLKQAISASTGIPTKISR